jgi:hypothetical protein
MCRPLGAGESMGLAAPGGSVQSRHRIASNKGRPDITLRIYAHLFRKDDSKAAAAINAALGS